MADILTMTRLLGFKDFYPNEKPHPKTYYASKIGREIIEKSTPFFLSYLRFGGFPEIVPLLQNWFTFNDFKYHQSPYFLHIETEYRRIVNFHDREKHGLLSVESLLNLFMWVTQEKDLPVSIKNPDASVTLPFLELILLFNDEVIANYEKATESTKMYDDKRSLQRLILAGSFSQSDLTNIDYAQLFYTQVYKKAKLLSFLSITDDYKIFLNKILLEFDCVDKEEFLKSIGSAVFGGVKSKEPSWTVLTTKNSPDGEKGAKILEHLTLDENDLSVVDQDDYLRLRNKPFQKIKDGEYRVIFELFLIKKLYNGLIFKLSSYDKNFLGKIRTDFSEEILLYEIVNSIFPSKELVKISGSKFKELQLDREPDFYLRSKDNVLLFESKDFFMTGSKKLSYDFSIIEGELMKDGRLKKAVIQLVRNIERCFKKEIPTDDSYTLDNVSIIPVIIVHDSLYSAPGLNYWVYYWFIDELKLLKKDPCFKDFNFANVLPVTIVEIDTLILYEEHFIQGRYDLISLIKQYHKYVCFGEEEMLAPEEVEKHALQSALSFSEFVRNFSHSIGIDINFNILSKILINFGIS